MMKKFLIAVGLTAALLGCTTPYVNIPEQPGDVAFHNPNNDTVRQVVVAALERAIRDQPPGGQYAVLLPPGSSQLTHELILERLPPGGGTIVDEEGLIPRYEVAQVLVRGWDARVDIIRPSGAAEPQLVSYYLTRDIEGWYVKRERVWRLPVEEALRIARGEPMPE